jgi:hypothetical protein
MGEDIGGDPVCWLNRVCENCGRFIGDEFAERCEHCGAARYEDVPDAPRGRESGATP